MHARRPLAAVLVMASLAAVAALGHAAVLGPAGATVAAAPSTPLPLPGPGSRVYVANEKTATVSVIDPLLQAVVATICLGSDRADDIAGTPGAQLGGAPCDAAADFAKPFYDGHFGTHGLWLTPDNRTLLATNRLSGTVVAIDATAACLGDVDPATPSLDGCENALLGYVPVGREPHLTTARPGTNEAWVAVRGEAYLDVLKVDRDDLLKPGLLPTQRIDHVAMIPTLRGPSMVSFTPDGRFAFIAAGKDVRVDKIDAASRTLVATQVLSSPFTPFGLVTPEGDELYLVHKGTGRLSILRTSDLGFLAQDVPIGARANHVAFVGNLAYITIAGVPGQPGGVTLVDRTSRQVVAGPPALLSTLGLPPQAAYLPAADWSGEPHGIWAAGRLLYIGHEVGDRVSVVDTGLNPDSPADDVVLATITHPLLKQPIDVVAKL